LAKASARSAHRSIDGGESSKRDRCPRLYRSNDREIAGIAAQREIASAMRIIMVGDSQTKLDRPFRRQVEVATMEVFLDFDPVFPGWPPENVVVDAAQEPQQDHLEWQAAS
jgi:hypothetical protein